MADFDDAMQDYFENEELRNEQGFDVLLACEQEDFISWAAFLSYYESFEVARAIEVMEQQNLGVYTMRKIWGDVLRDAHSHLWHRPTTDYRLPESFHRFMRDHTPWFRNVWTKTRELIS